MSDSEPTLKRRDFLKFCVGCIAGIFVPDEQLEKILIPRHEEKLRVDENSYLAGTHEEATEVARRINFIPRNEYEHPSNMCGPLAAAIMRDSGFYPAELVLNPSEFWLADPNRLNDLLPEKMFVHYHIEQSVRDYDFGTNPLKVGDFLFLHGGTFGHMIVVLEIDNSRRAYAISNVHKGNDQYTIEKILLYDPSNSPIGFFRDNWTRRGSVNGTTGVAFDIWRLKEEFISERYK